MPHFAIPLQATFRRSRSKTAIHGHVEGKAIIASLVIYGPYRSRPQAVMALDRVGGPKRFLLVEGEIVERSISPTPRRRR